MGHGQSIGAVSLKALWLLSWPEIKTIRWSDKIESFA